MKKLFLGALAATLVTSCATTSDGPSEGDTALPPEAAAVPGEESGPLSNDPFLNSGAESTDPSALATAPTETPSAPPADAPAAPPVTPSETPASPVAEAPPVPVAPQDLPQPVTDGQSTPAPEMSATADTSNSNESTSATAASNSEPAPAAPGATTPPPYTQSTTLDSTTQANNPSEPSSATPTPPPVMEAQGSGEKRNYRQQLKEYQDRAQTSAQEAEDLDQRANFAHEGGAWQVGLDWDFTGITAPATIATGTITDTKTYGAALSWSYFPLRGIDTGRLGVGLRGGAYTAKYETNVGGTARTSPGKLAAFSYGLRATYEFDYWIAQLLVPFAFVGYDQISIKGRTDTATGVTVAGQKFGSVNYGAGLNFNLNRLEPRAASRSLVSTGIRKFYLSYTFQQRSGELTGASHFLGLRFEY